MTEEQLCNLVLEVAGKTERELPKFRILGLITEGLELFAKRVASQLGYKGLQTDFLVAPVAGRLNLSTIPGLLFEPTRVTVRVASGNAGITILDSIRALEHGGLPKDQVFCARDGDELVFRDTNGSLNAYATAVKVKANQIPSLDNLKSQYNGAFAAVMAELAVGKAAPAEMTGVSV